MNKKGFIHAYIIFIVVIVLMMLQLLQVRYSTVLQFHATSKNAYYCEMYIFQNLIKRMNNTQHEEQSNKDEEVVDEGDSKHILSEPQMLQFKQCQITLEQRDKEIYAQYQSDEIRHGLIITMDEEHKEILDVAYEY